MPTDENIIQRRIIAVPRLPASPRRHAVADRGDDTPRRLLRLERIPPIAISVVFPLGIVIQVDMIGHVL
jgi:hypothetical protein